MRLYQLALPLLCIGSTGILLTGCSTSPDAPTQKITLNGKAMAGEFVNAQVTIYALTSQGQRGALLGKGTTDSKGNYSIASNYYPGPVELIVSANSNHSDEATGAVMPYQGELCARVPKPPTDGTGVALTPFSDIACQRSRTLKGSVSIGQAISAANRQVANLFGLQKAKGNTNLTAIIPNLKNTNKSDPTSQAALMLAGLSQMASDLGIDQNTLIQIIGLEFQSGGKLGGKTKSSWKSSKGVSLSAVLPTEPQAWVNAFETAQKHFLAGLGSGLGYHNQDLPPINTSPPLVIPPPTDVSLVPADAAGAAGGPVPAAWAAVASNNGGAPVFCSCNIPSLNQCIDYSGSTFATACASLGSSCGANAQDAVLSNTSCAVVGVGLGGKCNLSSDPQLAADDYYLSTDPAIQSLFPADCGSVRLGVWYPITVPPPPVFTTVASKNGLPPVYCSCNIPSYGQCYDYSGSAYQFNCANIQASCPSLSPDAVFSTGTSCAQMATPVPSTGTGARCNLSIDPSVQSDLFYYSTDLTALNSTIPEDCMSTRGGSWYPNGIYAPITPDLSNNGGPAVYCSCNDTSGSGQCTDYSGNFNQYSCASLQSSCAAISATAVLASGVACPVVPVSGGGGCSVNNGSAVNRYDTYYYTVDPNLLSTYNSSCSPPSIWTPY